MKSIFITGAAAGIGKAIAEHFHANGWFVGLYDIDSAGVERLARELGKNALAGELDVTDIQAWKSQLDAFFKAAGNRLDALINNAGIIASGPFEDIPIERHEAIANINFAGMMKGCHAALPYLKQTPESCVVNIASASAMYGQPSLVSYAASKFAVRGFTEGLNLEWEAQGVRVVDVWPIFVQTAMVENMKAKSIKTMGVKLGPEDVAKVVEKAVKAGPKSHKVHWIVGADAKFINSIMGMFPNRLSRWINAKIGVGD
ncbi:MAG: SDR family oxidoreductase [Salinisphaeraceae bacterium]|nr:SDR family oxidoreductase [Salinisphaeraceae bacterium]